MKTVIAPTSVSIVPASPKSGKFLLVRQDTKRPYMGMAWDQLGMRLFCRPSFKGREYAMWMCGLLNRTPAKPNLEVIEDV